MSADDTGQGVTNNTGGAPTLDMTHPQCINRLQEVREQMGKIAELARPSEEDNRYFNELAEEFDKVDAYRKKLERDAILNRVKGTAEGLSGSRHLRLERGSQTASNGDGYDSDAFLEPDSIEARRFRNPWDLREMRTYGRPKEEVNGELRARALDAIEKMPSATDAIREAGTRIVESFDDKDATISRMAVLSSSPAYVRAFSKAATNRLHELSDDEQRALAEVRALSLTDSAGGYLVNMAS